MKIIKYQLCTEVNHGTEEEPNIEQIFSAVILGWSAANEEIAKREAHNGKRWTSDVDNNAWEPGVYGWTEYAE